MEIAAYYYLLEDLVDERVDKSVVNSVVNSSGENNKEMQSTEAFKGGYFSKATKEKEGDKWIRKST